MKKIFYLFFLFAFSPIHYLYCQTWMETGGLSGLAANSYIQTTCRDGSGNIYAAGNFTKAG